MPLKILFLAILLQTIPRDIDLQSVVSEIDWGKKQPCLVRVYFTVDHNDTTTYFFVMQVNDRRVAFHLENIRTSLSLIYEKKNYILYIIN